MESPKGNLFSQVPAQLLVHAIVAAVAAVTSAFATVRLLQADIDYIKQAQASSTVTTERLSTDVGQIKEFVSAQRVANENAERRLQRLENGK